MHTIRFVIAALVATFVALSACPAFAQVAYDPASDDGWIEAWCEAREPEQIAARCFVQRRQAWDECHDAASFYRCAGHAFERDQDDALAECEARFCMPPMDASLPTWTQLRLACDVMPVDAPGTGSCEFKVWDRAYEFAEPGDAVECVGRASSTEERDACWDEARAFTERYSEVYGAVTHSTKDVDVDTPERPHARLAEELVGYVAAFEGCDDSACHDDLAVALGAWRDVNDSHLGKAQRAIVKAMIGGESMRLRQFKAEAATGRVDATEPDADPARFEAGFLDCTRLDPTLGTAAALLCTAPEAAAACDGGDPRPLLLADATDPVCTQRLARVWSGLVVTPLSTADEAEIGSACASANHGSSDAVCAALLRDQRWTGIDDWSCVKTAATETAFWTCLEGPAEP